MVLCFIFNLGLLKGYGLIITVNMTFIEVVVKFYVLLLESCYLMGVLNLLQMVFVGNKFCFSWIGIIPSYLMQMIFLVNSFCVSYLNTVFVHTMSSSVCQHSEFLHILST
jgi:hypothetical protein